MINENEEQAAGQPGGLADEGQEKNLAHRDIDANEDNPNKIEDPDDLREIKAADDLFEPDPETSDLDATGAAEKLGKEEEIPDAGETPNNSEASGTPPL